MFKNNSTLLIIALIAIVNALGYGIIIPILYTYTQSFGLTDFQSGLLFSVFSLCQLFSTPIIGKLSDKLGRKPLLIMSLVGTALSFVMMAFAKNIWMLFLARALDGVTAGNIPVASAVISDSTEPKDRAKGFAIIGAAFGFGFVAGPAISALTYPISHALPFLIAAGVSLLAVVLTAFKLPETHKHRGTTSSVESFHFARLLTAIGDVRVGLTLLISLLYSFSFAMFTFSFQPFATKLVRMTPSEISYTYVGLGIIGLIAQGFLIPKIVKKTGDLRLLTGSLFLAGIGFVFLSQAISVPLFLLAIFFYGFVGAPVGPLIQSLLSKEVDASSQGSILGLNVSYISVGTIIGPIVGGSLSVSGLQMPFVASASLCLICGIIALMHRRRLAIQKARL